MKLQRVSLDHLAKLAGVHKTTVSRALRNHPTIPAATRERIHAIALQEGYRPNPLVTLFQAQARANRPTSMQSALAWINDYPNPTCWQELPWLRGYMQGARLRCQSLGFRLEEISAGEIQTSGGRDSHNLTSVLKHRGIFGCILPLMLHRQWLHGDWSGCVISLIGSGQQATFGPGAAASSPYYPSGVPIADRDFYFNVRLAYQTALQRGHTRVGFVYSRYLDSESEGRTHSGYLVEQSLQPESQRIPVLFLEKFKEGRPAAFDQWMATYQPDVILAINPAVREWVEQLGIPVPDQCGLINLNVVGDVENWSGIRENHDLIGAAAVDLLIGQLSRNEIGVPRQPRKVLIPGTWHEGSTLRTNTIHATERR